ncbi:hypothetical protein ACE1CD_03435 [Aerosakkonema sp. BLCC-F183]|uniref:hypothetical protein n=1 Tax=Aerosakkonema sp. BLCC-F183 TaxID=3342834 RepID=UPI0035BA540F
MKLASVILSALVIVAASTLLSFAQTDLIPEWSRYDNLAQQAAKKGDYDTAIMYYQKARQVAAENSDPVLRQCFIFGAEAREAGAQAAREYLRTHGRNRAALAQASRIQQAAFREAANRLFVGGYENGCP